MEIPTTCGVFRDSLVDALSAVPSPGSGTGGGGAKVTDCVSVDDGRTVVLNVVELDVRGLGVVSGRVEEVRLVETDDVVLVVSGLLVGLLVVSIGGTVTAPLPEGGSTTVAVMTVCVG